jgi:hypothetical protein
MAQRKTPTLEGPSAASVAQRARRASELAKITEIVDANLNPTDAWRTIHPEHIEAIKTRLIGGDTLNNVCKGLGIDRASVMRHIHENKELRKEYLEWRATGAHALYDNLLDLPFDDSMSAADKLLYYKIVANYAPKVNREELGDRMRVDQTVTVTTPVMPDWFFGNVVDGQLTDENDPTI